MSLSSVANDSFSFSPSSAVIRSLSVSCDDKSLFVSSVANGLSLCFSFFLLLQRLLSSVKSLSTTWCGRLRATRCSTKHSPLVSSRSPRLAGRNFRSSARRDRRLEEMRRTLRREFQSEIESANPAKRAHPSYFYHALWNQLWVSWLCPAPR